MAGPLTGGRPRLGILAADVFFTHPKVRAQLGAWYELCDLSGYATFQEGELAAACRSVDVLIMGRKSPQLPESLAEDFGRLRYLCYPHGSIRHLVPRILIEKGLIVTNWGDQVANVAEGAMALLLAQLKQVGRLDHFSRTGEDRRIHQNFPCTLNKRRVGLYGFGPIGRHMARMLEPFGADISIYDPFAQDVPSSIRVCGSLAELFSNNEIISIHCGLNAATQRSVTAELLALLPQGAVLVNTARGGVVDEEALAAAVGAGKILAGIDVIADESGPDAWRKSPLSSVDGVILSQHRISGGKGYEPGKAPEPALPDFVVHNLSAYAKYLSGHAEQPVLLHVVELKSYDLKT